MQVPFVDLKRQYESIQTEIDQAIQKQIVNTQFIGGKVVKDFEVQYAEFIGVKHCISCANGTDSIEILLQAFGIQSGDEVIVPAHSWIATSEAVSSLGATPVFVDTHPTRHTIDTSKIEQKITKRTKAIIPVHLCGLPAEMDEIMALANKYKLKVLEDSAQAHNSFYKGKKIGTIGHAASFSFYPGKNLGAYGDAGAMVTNDDEIAQKARMIANHGQLEKHNHIMEGRNSRLDSIQAAVLSVKLKHLDTWTEARIKNALFYNELLKEIDIQLPEVPEYSRHVFHLYVIQTDHRDRLKNELSQAGIGTAIHYPTSLPYLKAYQNMDHEDQFEVARKNEGRILSLPMFPELREEEMEYVADSIRKFVP